MLTKQELINYCLSLPLAYLDYPFSELPSGGETAVLRHKENKKSFALFLHHEGKELVNVKCEPLEAVVQREIYSGVTPGWHMNKQHWNSLEIGSDIPDEIFRKLIEDSYDLIKPKARKGKKTGAAVAEIDMLPSIRTVK